MDKPGTSRELLINTLRHFSIINRLFSCHRRLIKRYIIADMLRDRQKHRRLLDLGAGGCDIDLWLTKTCRAKRLELDIICLDKDPRVVEYAIMQTRHVPNIEVVCADAKDIDKFAERFDYVLANHLLHHFASADTEMVLKKINTVCDRVFIINDLLRCYSCYLIYTLIAALFFHHSFAFTDGRISINKGFTRREFIQMVRNTRLKGRTIVGTAFPGHIYIVNCC